MLNYVSGLYGSGMEEKLWSEQVKNIPTCRSESVAPLVVEAPVVTVAVVPVIVLVQQTISKGKWPLVRKYKAKILILTLLIVSSSTHHLNFPLITIDVWLFEQLTSFWTRNVWFAQVTDEKQQQRQQQQKKPKQLKQWRARTMFLSDTAKTSWFFLEVLLRQKVVPAEIAAVRSEGYPAYLRHGFWRDKLLLRFSNVRLKCFKPHKRIYISLYCLWLEAELWEMDISKASEDQTKTISREMQSWEKRLLVLWVNWENRACQWV